MAKLSSNLPTPDQPFTDEQRRITEAWLLFLVQIFRRTGSSVGTDAGAIAQALNTVEFVVAEGNSSVPAAKSLSQGNGISVTIGPSIITISLAIPVEVENGGTGLESLASHALLVGNGADAPNLLVPGSIGQALLSQGPDFDPSYSDIVNEIDAGDGISVSSPTGAVTVGLDVPVEVPLGGTGNIALAAHGVVIGNDSDALNVVAIGTAGQSLLSTGTANDPSFGNAIDVVGGSVDGSPIGSLTPSTGVFSKLTNGENVLLHSSATLSNGAGAQTATITNAPLVGNPTKWIAIDDNGTTRHLPAW